PRVKSDPRLEDNVVKQNRIEAPVRGEYRQPKDTPRKFFFSSRRRHTRSKRDWSSDVCSSDLHWKIRSKDDLRVARDSPTTCKTRSEERRVGKESRSRWGRAQEKKQAAVDALDRAKEHRSRRYHRHHDGRFVRRVRRQQLAGAN